MKVYKISLTAWTASFRYPNLISGNQPTLPVPPISTVLGLINAAAGQYLFHESLRLAYRFTYEARASDLEKIYMMEGDGKGSINNRAKSNILHREFLADVRLDIYTPSAEIVDLFEAPFFQLLIGRSGDLASVQSIGEIELKKADADETTFSGQLIPFSQVAIVPGIVQPLPVYFSDDLPRKNLGTRPFVMVDWRAPVSGSLLTGLVDEPFSDDGQMLYFHHLRNNQLVF